LGHLAHRDNMKLLIYNGGTSFLIGLLFGDVTGSSALIFASRTLVSASYSREAETAADTFSIEVMQRLGRPPQAMGEFVLPCHRQGGRQEHLDPVVTSADRGSPGAHEQGRADDQRKTLVDGSGVASAEIDLRRGQGVTAAARRMRLRKCGRRARITADLGRAH